MIFQTDQESSFFHVCDMLYDTSSIRTPHLLYVHATQIPKARSPPTHTHRHEPACPARSQRRAISGRLYASSAASLPHKPLRCVPAARLPSPLSSLSPSPSPEHPATSASSCSTTSPSAVPRSPPASSLRRPPSSLTRVLEPRPCPPAAVTQSSASSPAHALLPGVALPRPHDRARPRLSAGACSQGAPRALPRLGALLPSLMVLLPGSTVTPDSIDDHLPDGFYDAGRDMPFMPLEEYECSIGLYAREVILLDRELDEELDAIASSAQLLLSSLKRLNYSETDEDAGQDLLRASVLALFVSDCFGGCDRSASIRRTRGSIVSLRKEQPFICTCAAGSICDSNEGSKQVNTPSGHFDFSGLCHKSIHIIKERRNSGIVSIGALQFGICRHRAVLMKYLCDRADPPIPCELVRGHLDYTPHAWNVVHVRQGGDWLRMIVDACYPTNIKEEMDQGYFYT